jgi:DNA-directed RNA polymerase specialized sigma24 family protein
VRQVPAPDTDLTLTPAAVPPELRSGEQPQELGQASGENETFTENVESEPTTDEAPADRRERARLLREAGWSNKRIARHLGVHASTVGRWFVPAHPVIGIESDTAGDEP